MNRLTSAALNSHVKWPNFIQQNPSWEANNSPSAGCENLCIVRGQNLQYRAQKTRPSTLSWARWIQFISSRPVSLKVHFIIIIIILYYICRSLVKSFLPYTFSDCDFIRTSDRSHVCYISSSHSPYTTLMNTCWRRQIMNFLNKQFYHNCVTSSLLGPNIHPPYRFLLRHFQSVF
jgi:hypothetical protein